MKCLYRKKHLSFGILFLFPMMTSSHLIFRSVVDAFERARKCFLEWRYFFSIILSEFLKNRVALHKAAVEAFCKELDKVKD